MRELNPLTYSALTTFGKVSEPSLELFHYIVFIGIVKGVSLIILRFLPDYFGKDIV